jgi:RND family efflux transporter MFP subunit
MQRTVDQNRTALKQVDAEIDRLKAQQRMREEQTLTEKLTVRYNIERARLEIGKEDVLPAIEIEKARLGLAKAEQKMREFEARQEADRVGAEADLTSLELKRDKAKADLAQSERSIAALTLTAPIGGVVTLSPNFRARTGMGMTAPMFKEGDRAWPGAAIAEIPDLESIQVNAPLDESERGALQLHQPVSLRIDAVPDREHKGVVAEISQLARLDYSSWPVKKNFDLTVRLEPIDSRLRPGMSATARVAVERLPDSILIPVEAVFEKGGRTVSFVQNAIGFKEQTIEVSRRGEGQVLISRGLSPGQHVALKDPTGNGGRTK